MEPVLSSNEPSNGGSDGVGANKSGSHANTTQVTVTKSETNKKAKSTAFTAKTKVAVVVLPCGDGFPKEEFVEAAMAKGIHTVTYWCGAEGEIGDEVVQCTWEDLLPKVVDKVREMRQKSPSAHIFVHGWSMGGRFGLQVMQEVHSEVTGFVGFSVAGTANDVESFSGSMLLCHNKNDKVIRVKTSKGTFKRHRNATLALSGANIDRRNHNCNEFVDYAVYWIIRKATKQSFVQFGKFGQKYFDKLPSVLAWDGPEPGAHVTHVGKNKKVHDVGMETSSRSHCRDRSGRSSSSSAGAGAGAGTGVGAGIGAGTRTDNGRGRNTSSGDDDSDGDDDDIPQFQAQLRFFDSDKDEEECKCEGGDDGIPQFQAQLRFFDSDKDEEECKSGDTEHTDTTNTDTNANANTNGNTNGNGGDSVQVAISPFVPNVFHIGRIPQWKPRDPNDPRLAPEGCVELTIYEPPTEVPSTAPDHQLQLQQQQQQHVASFDYEGQAGEEPRELIQTAVCPKPKPCRPKCLTTFLVLLFSMVLPATLNDTSSTTASAVSPLAKLARTTARKTVLYTGEKLRENISQLNDTLTTIATHTVSVTNVTATVEPTYATVIAYVKTTKSLRKANRTTSPTNNNLYDTVLRTSLARNYSLTAAGGFVLGVGVAMAVYRCHRDWRKTKEALEEQKRKAARKKRADKSGGKTRWFGGNGVRGDIFICGNKVEEWNWEKGRFKVDTSKRGKPLVHSPGVTEDARFLWFAISPFHQFTNSPIH